MPRWSPSVTVAAIVSDGGTPPRFLLVEEETSEGLRLNNPAGHLEPGETPEQGVVREVLEETACDFVPEALLGLYLARLQRAAGPDADGEIEVEDVTYLRFAYRGRVGDPIPGRALDQGIVRTLWLTADELRAEQPRHRSPLVMRCIDDHLAGRGHALDAVFADASLTAPEQRAGGDNARPMQDPLPPDSQAAAETAAPADAPESPAEPAPVAAAAPARTEPSPAETGAELAQLFPALFTPGRFKPLKLRIQADIQQRAPGLFTRRQLSVFLHRYTTSTGYLKALVAAPQRIDLDGVEAGEIAAEHRDAAAAEVERRRAIVAARRGPRDEAPRRDAGPHAERPAHGERGERRPRSAPGERADRGPRPGPREPREARGERRPPAPRIEPAADALLPDDPARRERALLLRAWEGSPLTPANFCALKGLPLADFEARIELARRERAERAA